MTAVDAGRRDGATPDTSPGLGLEILRPGSNEVTEWSFSAPEHTVLLWRRGIVADKQVAFAGKRMRQVSARRSGIWVVPAGDSASALARDTVSVEYMRLLLPTHLITTGSLRQVVSQTDPVLHGLLERIVSTAGREDAVARLLRDALFDSARLHVLDAYGTDRRLPIERGRELDHVTRDQLSAYLHDSFDRDVQLDALADIAGMSVRSFRRAFRVAFGTTPHQYLLDLRVGRAQALLTTTRLSAAEIAALTGFSNPSHFATTFKRRVGVSPTRFRADAQ
ncbi:MAG: helix-turn-helix transcriptional regulator [Rhodococcus sp.]|nr:helix-turn-helix transcriptional regulator [Rhodococcus sp. (in: high G+C Gram-positive bacteria)]